MKLITSALICAAALCWVDATYFNGAFFQAVSTLITQLVARY
jgi:hypothetical protein